MFARAKRSGSRAYLVIVENRRNALREADGTRKHVQVELARLGRLDHLPRGHQDQIVQELSMLLSQVRRSRAVVLSGRVNNEPYRSETEG